MVKALVLDFGGVLADEGFREGLKAIAKNNGLNPEEFFVVARNLIYTSGYVTGETSEHGYWEAIRVKTNVRNGDNELRREILNCFVLRRPMLEEIKRVRAAGVTVALLTDQTNWLDELNQQEPFYQHFDRIFNSFNLKRSKRDATLFDDVAGQLGVKPQEILFVDDTPENLERAQARGWKTLRFTNVENFRKAIKEENI
ncbi:MAG TPA: HAD family phosphatase [Syntrophorhabdales bacterium]|nr:HAD family phosphatase [Syntrophorhabdales bacterium]